MPHRIEKSGYPDNCYPPIVQNENGKKVHWIMIARSGAKKTQMNVIELCSYFKENPAGKNELWE